MDMHSVKRSAQPYLDCTFAPRKRVPLRQAYWEMNLVELPRTGAYESKRSGSEILIEAVIREPHVFNIPFATFATMREKLARQISTISLGKPRLLIVFKDLSINSNITTAWYAAMSFAYFISIFWSYAIRLGDRYWYGPMGWWPSYQSQELRGRKDFKYTFNPRNELPPRRGYRVI